MKKRITSIFLLIFISILFLNCTFFKEVGVYEKIDDTYYFEDYTTMKKVIIPEINTSFKEWHWYNEKFDNKFEIYKNNIEPNEENLQILQVTNYIYAVKINTSGKKVFLKKENENDTAKSISGKYFWITTKDSDAVVFFMN